MSSLPRGNRAAYFCHRLRDLLPVPQLRLLLARGTTDRERRAESQQPERGIMRRTCLESTAGAESLQNCAKRRAEDCSFNCARKA